MATQITIANLPPPPAETGSGIVKGTNVIPGTDPLDTSSDIPTRASAKKRAPRPT